jgi:dCTP deaminase
VSILTGPEIERVVTRTRADKAAGKRPGCLPWIDVTPFDPAMCGPNSYDVRLGDTLLTYDLTHSPAIDPNKPPPTKAKPLCDVRWCGCYGGWLLSPRRLYLGATAERIACHGVVPWIDGRSSVGRLGVSVHVTAGRGDDGWPGPGREPAPFTLEITVVHPTILRPGMRLAQLTFMRVEGERRPYAGRYGEATAAPVASRFHQEGR